MSGNFFPELNASLNALSGLLLVMGYVCIRRQKVVAHKLLMLSAFGVSCIFLCSYLYYHAHYGSTSFQSQGPVRFIYFTILISHTILATAVIPLIIKTLYHVWRGSFVLHRKWARVTFPLWLYVSITGVLVYWLLYHVDAS